MPFEQSSVCALHGPGFTAGRLIGCRLVEVTASWFRHAGGQSMDPLDVWLTVERNGAIRITTGSDWCLIVDASEPYAGYDLGEGERVEVCESDRETPFSGQIGERILGAREEYEPSTGRIGLDLTFATGRVRCESWAGELRLKELPKAPHRLRA